MFDVRASPLLAAVIQAMRLAGPTLRSAMYKYTDLYIRPAWEEELGKRSVTLMQQRVLGAGANAITHDNGLSVWGSASFAAFSGGLVPVESGRAFEFGTSIPTKRTYLTRSRKGTVYRVTRTTTNQLPSRSRTGWMVYPAAKAAGTRLMSLLIQTVVRTLHDASEGKR